MQLGAGPAVDYDPALIAFWTKAALARKAKPNGGGIWPKVTCHINASVTPRLRLANLVAKAGGGGPYLQNSGQVGFGKGSNAATMKAAFEVGGWTGRDGRVGGWGVRATPGQPTAPLPASCCGTPW